MLVLGLAGCASNQRALQLRDQIRENQVEAERPGAIDRAAYRSTESIQSARWGMTRDEVLAAVPDATEWRSALNVARTVADLNATVTYRFTHDQLAEIDLRFPPVPDSNEYQVLRSALELSHGKAKRTVDTLADGKRSLEASRAAAAVGLALAVVGDVTLAAHGDEAGAFTELASAGLDGVQLQEQQMLSSPQLRESDWFSPETRVVLISEDGDPTHSGPSVLHLHYRSRVIPPSDHGPTKADLVRYGKGL